jgi:hypothetical protein
MVVLERFMSMSVGVLPGHRRFMYVGVMPVVVTMRMFMRLRRVQMTMGVALGRVQIHAGTKECGGEQRE